MKLSFSLLTLLSVLIPVSSFALDPVRVDDSFSSRVIGTQIEYLEDRDKKLTIDQAPAADGWKPSKGESLNFGFTPSVYWFRFTVDYAGSDPMNLFLDISYPLLNYVDFYIPEGEGYRVVKTGNHYPFYEREIEDKNFVFNLRQGPGLHTYYMRVETKSSINFVPTLMTQKAYFHLTQTKTPVFWIYYGLMIIMLIYNFFIFLASRDKSYILYVAFIASYILFQMTLNGYSFQYLWPEAIWWGSNCLPFFMCSSVATAAIFMRAMMDLPGRFPGVNRVMTFGVIVPSSIWAVCSLIAPYALAIKVATALVGVLSVVIHVCVWYTLFKKSREAIFITVGYLGLVAGIVLYVLKTFAILPEMFITEWGVQIGSSMVIVFLSLALADKINVMRKDLKVFASEQEEIKKEAQNRAENLEGIVRTATGISEEFMNVTREMQEISRRFSDMSMEQAATSEEMSSTFEELSASIDNIYHATINQKDEGEKSKLLVIELNLAQKSLIEESQRVEDSIREIQHQAGVTGDSLKRMDETMSVINSGGKEIKQFIGMIDDISDRINLLSLNAAIEAARAGEYGRGFAVVADEIGKLAQATSDNSKEIGKQVSRIITDMDSGAVIVTGTKESTDVVFKMVGAIGRGVDGVKIMMTKQNSALDGVIRQADVIEKMSKEIVISTNEQKNSMEQTMKTIERMSEMAQEISIANTRIMDFIKIIQSKAAELNAVVKQ
ncbi:MAG TPA: 7TM diverse intracellular signaling domain-containing protein [Spirochaetota bacterium]|nr:7TM diverse intracellular signaling domain-containing protein [Spirochaetota bacterium]HRZ27039.1 7TM diverse intracellular signaling domain-containing protein [Spirochaetota bacterium]HSA13994.1 7TM diverse intracellular signaling domain-containing protein [Spirochaetota bacterium]